MAVERFPFAFDKRFRPLLAGLGVLPSTSYVLVDDERLEARFGLWRLSTPLTNVAEARISRGYRWFKVIGPRLSLADRGVTFGTNARAGVCVLFHEPVPVMLGQRIRHPGATLTVADPLGLVAALERERAD